MMQKDLHRENKQEVPSENFTKLAQQTEHRRAVVLDYENTEVDFFHLTVSESILPIILV